MFYFSLVEKVWANVCVCVCFLLYSWKPPLKVYLKLHFFPKGAGFKMSARKEKIMLHIILLL